MWCVCSGYKRTGEVTWLVNGTELSRKPSAQKTKGWDVSFSNQGWDKHGRDDITMITANKHKITSQGVKPPFFISFFPHLTRTFFDCVAGQITAAMTITSWGFRRGFQGLADPSASTHTHTRTLLHLLSPSWAPLIFCESYTVCPRMWREFCVLVKQSGHSWVNTTAPGLVCMLGLLFLYVWCVYVCVQSCHWVIWKKGKRRGRWKCLWMLDAVCDMLKAKADSIRGHFYKPLTTDLVICQGMGSFDSEAVSLSWRLSGKGNIAT